MRKALQVLNYIMLVTAVIALFGAVVGVYWGIWSSDWRWFWTTAITVVFCCVVAGCIPYHNKGVR